jgi:EmrB/QacA subfamily drug resistance transporter
MTTNSDPTASSRITEPPERVDWWLLGNTMLVNFLTGTATRIFAISLPTLAQNLETDLIGISWALLSYQLATISLSLVFGRIGDLYGRHTVFTVGLVTFTASTFLCGFSQDVFQLILFRLFQGIGAAMTQAQGRALAMEAVPGRWAGKAQGFMTTAHHSGYLFGPSLGGLIIDYLHWRGTFFLLVPLGILGIGVTLLNKRAAPTPSSSEPRQSIDYPGALLLSAATVALIALLDRRIVESLPGHGRMLLATALAGLTLGFLIREYKAQSPLLDLSLFKIRLFAFSTVSLLLVSTLQTMTNFLLPFYLQEILLLSPTFMGILFMTFPLFSVTLSPLAGSISDKVGPSLPATAGIIVYGAALGIGAIARTDSHWLLPMLMIALAGLSNAFFFPPNHAALIGSVPADHRGVATGTLYTMFGLGNIFGLTLAGSLMTTFFRLHANAPQATPTPADPEAFVGALNSTFLIGVGITLAAAICSFLRGKKP